MLYKIGDFSKKTGLSIRTLRYYDEIDLFKPIEIDLYTGYRYYSDSQLDTLNIITELKEAGFMLEEIKEYWGMFDNDIMLKKRQDLIETIEGIENKIRKLDYLRSKIHNGQILLNGNTENIKMKTIF